MDKQTKKRYAIQMIANVEQLIDGAKELDIPTKNLVMYRTALEQIYNDAKEQK